MCPDSEVINHPVHIVTKDNQLSPSAFIPFCDFGGEMLTVGAKIDQFHVPVCNSFEAKLFNDQLCYEVDLEKFSDKQNIERELKLGFIFLITMIGRYHLTKIQLILMKALVISSLNQIQVNMLQSTWILLVGSIQIHRVYIYIIIYTSIHTISINYF